MDQICCALCDDLGPRAPRGATGVTVPIYPLLLTEFTCKYTFPPMHRSSHNRRASARRICIPIQNDASASLRTVWTVDTQPRIRDSRSWIAGGQPPRLASES